MLQTHLLTVNGKKTKQKNTHLTVDANQQHLLHTHMNFIEDLFVTCCVDTQHTQAGAPALFHFLQPPLGISSARVCNPYITFDTRVTRIAPLELKDI